MFCRALLGMLWAAGFALAEVNPFVCKGFTITQEVEYSTTPDTLFDLMTGEISPWWDHHFSDRPVRFFIEPRPGGGFYEDFDDSGNGVKHATVISAERGKLLRMEGPLGLSGKAVVCVWTWEYEPTPQGTKLKFTGNLTGQIEENFEQIIAQVWHHFLVEQLQPYIVGGTWRKK
ncbi:SRPBCC domain-containing protein [candidate division KSB1 bacterium]|nr:SRPBCC domain-containing protein [candidate division KSB1 bacterium]